MSTGTRKHVRGSALFFGEGRQSGDVIGLDCGHDLIQRLLQATARVGETTTTQGLLQSCSCIVELCGHCQNKIRGSAPLTRSGGSNEGGAT